MGYSVPKSQGPKARGLRAISPMIPNAHDLAGLDPHFIG